MRGIRLSAIAKDSLRARRAIATLRGLERMAFAGFGRGVGGRGRSILGTGPIGSSQKA